MKLQRSCFFVLLLTLCMPIVVQAGSTFSFAAIAKPDTAVAGTASVQKSIEQTDRDNLAFVVISGIKAKDEPCSDTLYQDRYRFLNRAKNGLIVSLAASDWTHCVNADNRNIAVERIARLREFFFTDEFSFGDSKLPLLRQSAIPSFRMYAENMQWRIGDILFATINLPRNNNNFLSAAGRNSEYEDRQVANADWIKRLLVTAKSNRLHGVVLFADANPMTSHARMTGLFSEEKREGFADIRRQISQAANDYHGRILIVHNAQDADSSAPQRTITWQGNIGAVPVQPHGWTRITVDASQKQLFSVSGTSLNR